MTLHQPEHEESLLEYAFGDPDRDPGRVLDQVSTCTECLAYIDHMLGDVTALREHAGRDAGPDEGALGRLKALKEVAAQRRADFDAEVVDLNAVRKRREERIASRRPVRAWTWGLGASLLAAGIALFVVMKQQDDDSDEIIDSGAVAMDVVPGLPATAGKKYADLVGDGGAFGFGGSEAPDAFTRGFLVAITLDLQPAIGAAAEPEALRLRRELAIRALQGLPGEDEPDKSVRKGCAIVPIAEQPNCLAGQYAYRMRRDLDAKIAAEAQAQARSDAAKDFLRWAPSRATDPKIREAIEAVRARVMKNQPFDSEERILWGRILEDMAPYRR